METILLLLFLGLLGTGIALPLISFFNSKPTKPVQYKTGVLLAILSLPVLALYAGYNPVQQGSIGVVKRMGAVVGTLPPGPHFTTPFVTTVDSVTTKTLTVNPSEDASSMDLQQVHTQVTLTYHFNPDGIIYIYTNLIDSSPNAVENKVVNPAILEAIKAATARYTVQDLVQKRAQVRDDIEALVKTRLSTYHITAETTSITDFRFSDVFEKSIESKQVAQQQAEQAQNELQKVKIEAEQKVAAAQGEAAALKAQKEQITPELLQLRMIEMLREKWDGKLPENYFGGQAPLPIVNAIAGKATAVSK